MLTDMIEFSHKMKEEMKARERERKEHIQGTNSEGKDTRTPIKDLEQKQEINIQPEQNEETIQNTEERLRNLQNNFKHSNIPIIQMPEEKRKSKNLKTYLNK